MKENDEPPIGRNRSRSRQVIDLARIAGNGATEFAVGKLGAASRVLGAERKRDGESDGRPTADTKNRSDRWSAHGASICDLARATVKAQKHTGGEALRAARNSGGTGCGRGAQDSGVSGRR